MKKSLHFQNHVEFFLPDVDKDNLFDGGPKSMIVIGFIQQNEIPVHLLLGDGNMIFQSIEENEARENFLALSTLSTMVDGGPVVSKIGL